MRFVNMLTSKSRESVLPEIVEQFSALHDEKLGVVNVGVKSAVELNYAQEKELKAQLERIAGKKVRLHLTVDTSIKAGLVIRIGDTVLDASLTRQLELMRERFVAGRAA
jgi:F-type H+-transporting ATPase subunit delta